MDIERAILVGVEFPREAFSMDISINELRHLARTAGAAVVGSLTQKRERPDTKYFIGKGKIEELSSLISQTGANLIIFDNDLKPSQQRNIEEFLNIKAVDRTQLILDIFAQHAHSQEGRLQVELAQAEFMISRLSGGGSQMSQLGGGIGTRGPGETKLEQDKRKIRKTISELKKGIDNIRKSRGIRRVSRQSSGIKTVSIVGYTNAGKSTLLNALTNADVLAEDKLFATLDTTTRRLYLKSGKTILISDTVGFIQKLPHQLIDAFKATLEEVSESDLLLHVVDASGSYFEAQIDAVYKVLEEIHAISKPIITVFNKTDILEKEMPKAIISKYSPSVEVSSLLKKGMVELKDSIETCL